MVVGPPSTVASQGLDDVPVTVPCVSYIYPMPCVIYLACTLDLAVTPHAVSDELATYAKRVGDNNKNVSIRVYPHDATPASAALSWAAINARNRESLRPTSSRYVPDSDIRPSSRQKKKHGLVLSQSSTAPDLPSSTTIRSARAIVDSRCATITHVVCRCANILSIASLTRCSLVASSALVASSSARIAGRFSSARAIARRWRWPPLRLCRPTVVRQERVLCK